MTRENKLNLFFCLKKACLSFHLSCLIRLICVILTSVDCMNTSNPTMQIMEMCLIFNIFKKVKNSSILYMVVTFKSCRITKSQVFIYATGVQVKSQVFVYATGVQVKSQVFVYAT